MQPQNGRSPLTTSDPGETAALNDARLRSDKQAVGDQSVIPGAAGFAASAERHGLPTAWLVVLIMFGLCASAATFTSVRRRVLGRRQR